MRSPPSALAPSTSQNAASTPIAVPMAAINADSANMLGQQSTVFFPEQGLAPQEYVDGIAEAWRALPVRLDV